MKKFLTLIILTSIFSLNAFSQEKQQKFMQITSMESVIGGGLGRSKMLITKDDGTQEELDMNNLFSLTGLNMKNIKENESQILAVLKKFINEGWKLQSTIPLTLSPGQNGQGIFLTRYLLVKEE
ncbi:MAG: hypothetical protein ACXWV4_05465 [Flavitalea sp.]